MASMQKLSADTVRLITSSQVITSVVSVVKEIIENSLDAGSDNIEIKLENYGFDKIEVRDNGRGIKAEDAPFMAKRHFTSKILNHGDLECLATYGFRGEALGSLCAMSSVSIVTKTAGEDFGRQYALDCNGGVVTTKPSHLGNGTTVTATHLFNNVPVRKQYYANPKRRRDELKKVEDLVMGYGVVRPDVRFLLSHDKSALWQKSRAANHKAALLNTLGSNVMSQMQYVKQMDDERRITIEGFVPIVTSDIQTVTKALPDRCWIAVNDRPVMFKEIEKTVKQAYCQAAGRDTASIRHLVMFLSITLPQHHVDVNLEPNKTRVLLQNQDDVLSVLSDLLAGIYRLKADNHPATLPRQENSIACNTESAQEGQKQLGDNTLCSTRNGLGAEDEIRDGAKNIRSVTDVYSENQNTVVQQRRNCDTLAACEPNEKTYLHPHQIYYNDLSTNQNLPIATNTVVDPGDSFKLNFDVFEDDSQQENFNKNTASNTVDELHKEVSHCAPNNTPHEPTSYKAADWTTTVESCDGVQSGQASLSLTNWSKGKGLINKNGELIQPAMLLVPKNANSDYSANSHADFNQVSTNQRTPYFNSMLSKCTVRVPDRETSAITNQKTAGFSSANQNISDSANDGGKLLNSVRIPDHEASTASTNQEAACLSSANQKLSNDSNDGDLIPNTLAAANEESTSVPLANQNVSPAKRRLSLEKKMGKGTMYDLISQTPVRRPQTAFEFFSKEIKPQVLEVNPRAPSSDLNRMVEEQWRQLEEDEREKYVEMGRKDAERHHNHFKAAQKKVGNNHDEVPSRKRKKLSLPPNQGLIDKMLLSQQRQKLANQDAEPVAPDIPTVCVSFNLIGLQRELKMYHETSTNSEDDQRLHLIGQLGSHGTWLAHHGNQIVVFNQYRVEETLLYHRLTAHHVLPCQPMEVPVVLSPSIVGGESNWNTLLGMPHEANPPDPALYCSDQRLGANGFELKQTVDSETQEVKLQVIAMATCVSYYGIDDLQRILELITTNNQVTLSQCRPLKVANYLKGEAVRMARNLPSTMGIEDVYDVIKRMKQLPSQCNKCLHNQPFEHLLYTIPDSDDV